jgi:rubrerythrin
MANESSRREILAASAALAGGAGVALLASCGGDDESKPEPTETVSTVQMQADAALAATLLDLEDSSVVAYAAIARRLSGRTRALALTFGAHERAHANALRSLLRSLGTEPGPPKPPAQYRATFPPLGDPRAALSFALDVEQTAIGAYADALQKVATDPMRVTLAAILATESEHAAVMLGRLERPQVPAAFVTGPPPELDS